jgi:hypothetical protein
MDNMKFNMEGREKKEKEKKGWPKPNCPSKPHMYHPT